MTGESESSWSYVPAAPSKVVHDWGCAFGGFSECSAASVDRLELPVASSVIVLCCGEPVVLQSALSPGFTARLCAFSAGLQVQAQRVWHTGVNDCVEIRLPPLAAFALFGGAVAESNQTPLDLLDVARQPVRILLDQLQAASEWRDRLAAVDQFLAGAFAQSRKRIPPELIWAWKTLERSHGQVAIRSLSRKIGWSERHLINQFCAYFGTRPKAVARRLRFSNAFNLITSRPADDLSTIAAQAGFSDQSHMTREFRDFSGLTPAVLRTARFDDLPGIPAAALLID
jgi:AraC-like DNA-binding protein